MTKSDFLCPQRHNRKGVYYCMPLTLGYCGTITNHKPDFEFIQGKKRGYGWYIQRMYKGRWK